LTILCFEEVWKYRLSTFKAVKENCPNLKSFSLLMTTGSVITTLNHLSVDKDVNFQLMNSQKPALEMLEHVSLSGPLCCDVVKYLLYGAEKVKSLSLAIEWLNPTFCNSQPSGT